MVAVADCRFPRCAFLCIGCEVEEVVLEKKKYSFTCYSKTSQDGYPLRLLSIKRPLFYSQMNGCPMDS